jgi:hypothetical protein
MSVFCVHLVIYQPQTGASDVVSQDQREGKGLLENQAIYSWRDVTHDGWLLCTFPQQPEIPSARSWAAPVSTTGTVWKRQAVRPVHHVQNHTSRVIVL